MKTKKLIIFDKDGTLIDIHHYWGRMIEARSLLLSNLFDDPSDKVSTYNSLIDLMGFDLSIGKLKTAGPVGIKPRTYIVDLVTQFFLSTSLRLSREDVERVFLLVDDYSKTNLKAYVRILPGVEATLASLKNSGSKIAIATTDLSARARIGLRAANIEQYINTVVGGDHVSDPKPSPEMLVKILDEFNVLPRESVMVGDACVDQEMAGAIDMDFIGVKTGLADSNFITNTVNSFWVEDMYEVKEILCE